MKDLGRVLLFILSTVLRLISFPIFILTHLFWGVYSFEIDPLRILEVSGIPAMLGDFGWLYFALSLIILVFLTLRFKFLAYGVFLTAWLGQNLFFFRRWDNLIYDAGIPSFLNSWYGLIFLGLLSGFILQVIFTGGTRYLKIRKYRELRRESREPGNS